MKAARKMTNVVVNYIKILDNHFPCTVDYFNKAILRLVENLYIVHMKPFQLTALPS